jgi:ribose transport system permease protein
VLIVVAVLIAVFLNMTVWGRHLLATGRNEEAARYSGIRSSRYILLAYLLCSLLAGLGGILFALDVNTVQPDNLGNFYELYAIAAAVLGGCSLRGGEGSVLGVIVGAALMRVLTNAVGVLGVKNQWEFAIIGIVILIAVVVDELLRRARLK